jgi:hypothetical protein
MIIMLLPLFQWRLSPVFLRFSQFYFSHSAFIATYYIVPGTFPPNVNHQFQALTVDIMLILTQLSGPSSITSGWM